MRFLKQTHKKNCVATALVNYRIWKGEKLTRSYLIKYSKQIGGLNGMSGADLYVTLALSQTRFDLEIGTSRIFKLVKHLKNRRGAIVCYEIDGSDPHAVFIYKRGVYYYLINATEDSGHVVCKETTLRKLLKNSSIPPIFFLLF